MHGRPPMPLPEALPCPPPELGPPDAARLDGHQAPHPDPRPHLPTVRDGPGYRGPPSRAGRGGRGAADGRLLAMPRRGHRAAGRGGALAWTLTGQAAPRSTAYARQHAHAASTARRPLSAAGWHEPRTRPVAATRPGSAPQARPEGGNPLAGVLAAAWLAPRNRCQVRPKKPGAKMGSVAVDNLCPACGAPLRLCPVCGSVIDAAPRRGRPRRYCSAPCRWRAGHQRRTRSARPVSTAELAGALAARTWRG
jgi:hypothetical protein